MQLAFHADERGPEKVLVVRIPELDLFGFVGVVGLPYGGGKAGAAADPGAPGKEEKVRAFARAIGTLTDHIPGPDMGTNETAMAWVKDEIGRVVGLPRVVSGIPPDEIGATGLGCAAAADVVASHTGRSLDGIVRNVGGVICAAVEYHGGSEAQARAVIVERISANVRELLARRERDGVSMRQAADDLARSRVDEANFYRRR